MVQRSAATCSSGRKVGRALPPVRPRTPLRSTRLTTAPIDQTGRVPRAYAAWSRLHYCAAGLLAGGPRGGWPVCGGGPQGGRAEVERAINFPGEKSSWLFASHRHGQLDAFMPCLRGGRCVQMPLPHAPMDFREQWSSAGREVLFGSEVTTIGTFSSPPRVADLAVPPTASRGFGARKVRPPAPFGCTTSERSGPG
jgi:hypothetical protein